MARKFTKGVILRLPDERSRRASAASSLQSSRAVAVAADCSVSFRLTLSPASSPDAPPPTSPESQTATSHAQPATPLPPLPPPPLAQTKIPNNSLPPAKPQCNHATGPLSPGQQCELSPEPIPRPPRSPAPRSMAPESSSLPKPPPPASNFQTPSPQPAATTIPPTQSPRHSHRPQTAAPARTIPQSAAAPLPAATLHPH